MKVSCGPKQVTVVSVILSHKYLRKKFEKKEIGGARSAYGEQDIYIYIYIYTGLAGIPEGKRPTWKTQA